MDQESTNVSLWKNIHDNKIKTMSQWRHQILAETMEW